MLVQPQTVMIRTKELSLQDCDDSSLLEAESPSEMGQANFARVLLLTK